MGYSLRVNSRGSSAQCPAMLASIKARAAPQARTAGSTSGRTTMSTRLLMHVVPRHEAAAAPYTLELCLPIGPSS